MYRLVKENQIQYVDSDVKRDKLIEKGFVLAELPEQKTSAKTAKKE